MKQSRNPAIPLGVLAGAAVMVWMIIFNIQPIRDPDIWWHLASGRYVITHATIPKTDVFSLTARGSAWVDTYWLQEVMAYLIHQAGGLVGITMTNAVAVALFVFLIGFKNPEPTFSWGAKLAAVVWIFLAGHPRGFGWGEKASLVTLGFLGLLFFTVRSTSWARRSKLMRLWPFLFIVWANMHRGFILGLEIFGLYVIEVWISEPQNGLGIALWWVVCAAATLINPYGWRVHGMGWQDFSHSPSNVMGWAQTPYSHLELFWFTLAIFWCAVGWTIWNRKRAGFGFFATSLSLSTLGVRYASLYPYFVIWSVPWLMALFDRETKLFENPKVFLCLMAAMIIASLDLSPAFGVNPLVFPMGALGFLKNNHLRHPFYHEYAHGGFFLWTLEDDPPVLIDGRYPAVQGYISLSSDIRRVIEGPPADFERFLNHLNIHAAVVKYPSTQFFPSPFSHYFPRKDWALIYWDDLVLIFVQRMPDFQKAIESYEFREIEPDAEPNYWLKTVWKPASSAKQSRMRGEFVRNLQSHPDSRRARRWLDLTKGFV